MDKKSAESKLAPRVSVAILFVKGTLTLSKDLIYNTYGVNAYFKPTCIQRQILVFLSQEQNRKERHCWPIPWIFFYQNQTTGGTVTRKICTITQGG